MSYMSAYTIGADGVVAERPSLEIRNPHSIAPVIWTALLGKYAPVGNGSINPAPLFRSECFSKMDRREQIVLLATSDGGWVAKENFPVLREALLWFQKEYQNPNSNVSTWAAWFDTIPETEFGACFYMTSVTENPWCLSEPVTADGDDPDRDWDDCEDRPFNFRKDERNAFGVLPLEIVSGVQGTTHLRGQRA